MHRSTRVFAAVIAFTIALPLGACTAVDVRQTPAGAVSEPGAEAAPGSYSADPASWTITQRGIGPVELGMQVSDAFDTLPAGASDHCPWLASWTAGGFNFLATNIRAIDDGPVQLVATTAVPGVTGLVGPRTAEGIGVGSTVEEVKAAYPSAQISKVTDELMMDGDRFVKVGDAIHLSLSEDDTVSAVTVTTLTTGELSICA